MELIGVQRVRSRDVATGIVLGAATGIAALFLYLDTTSTTTTGATQQILFGSIFTIDPPTVPVVGLLSAVTLVAIAAIHRPLLLSSVSTELAAARGVRTRLVGLAFILALGVAVGLSSIAIGSILSTALLIGPPATALRLTRSVVAATVVASVLGVATTWLGILLAYDSYYWDRSSQGLPVSFFIVAIGFLAYLASGLPLVRRWVGRSDAGRTSRAEASFATHEHRALACSPASWCTRGRWRRSSRSSAGWSASSSCSAARRSPPTPSQRARSPGPPVRASSASARSWASACSRCSPPSGSGPSGAGDGPT